MQKFNAMIARANNHSVPASVESITDSDLPKLDVLIDVEFSTLNYKDALAVSGKGKICRRLPMVCGIDLAGTVVESADERWQLGDQVLINGYGLSETQWGGYSQRQRVSADWLVKLPREFSCEQAMAIGTAGYTAMLSVLAIQDHGIVPADGDVLVTGASGGVGSVALLLLDALGYSSVAASGSELAVEFLTSLGAGRVIHRSELDRPAKPLEKEYWAAGIDSVGGLTLATLLAQLKYEGVVAACGLAGGADLPSSVMPFILRGATLRGIDSVMASLERRPRAWAELARLIDTDKLDSIYQVQAMSNLPTLADRLLAGQITGRIVIDVNA